MVGACGRLGPGSGSGVAVGPGKRSQTEVSTLQQPGCQDCLCSQMQVDQKKIQVRAVDGCWNCCWHGYGHSGANELVMVPCEGPLGRTVEGRIELRKSQARVLLAGAPWLDQGWQDNRTNGEGGLGGWMDGVTGGDGMERERRKPTKAEKKGTKKKKNPFGHRRCSSIACRRIKKRMSKKRKKKKLAHLVM